MSTNPITADFILDELRSVSDASHLEGMKRYAIATDKALGVSLPHIRSIASAVKKQVAKADRHALALQLWDSDIHEARILAAMVDDPKQVTRKQMDDWVKGFKSWDLCDQVCANLFQKTDFFLEKAEAYSHKKDEFIKRTGFVLMVQYAVHHKKAADRQCLHFLQRIEEEAWDNRNFVRKATNWCLRQIGKRSAWLHPHAIACAERVHAQNTPSARWIANDALRELRSDAVKQRLGL